MLTYKNEVLMSLSIFLIAKVLSLRYTLLPRKILYRNSKADNETRTKIYVHNLNMSLISNFELVFFFFVLFRTFFFRL